ncbi:MAG: AAA family ATPase [Anaerolineae bacterium]|nr:AAA family ATPase [Anaerolineae bacterium]
MAIQPLTVKQRIFLHLFEFNRFADEYTVPIEVTQTGIAEAAGIRVQHVTQYVKPLIADHLVVERTRHIQGQPRRRKAYFLEHGGRQEAASLRRSLLKETVPYRTLGNEIRETTLSDVYQETRRGSELLELLQELETSGQISEVTLRPSEDLVDFSLDAPVVEKFYGRTEDVRQIRQALASAPLVVVTGMAGMGKTALGSVIRDDVRKTKSVFWRGVRSWDSSIDLVRSLAVFLKALGRFKLSRLLARPETPSLGMVREVIHEDLAGLDVLLIFDDLHEATSEAAAYFVLLHEALKRTEGPSVLLLSRTVPDFYSRRDVDVDRSVVEYTLTGLAPRDSFSFLSDAGVPRLLAQTLVTLSEGHPLFLKLLASVQPTAGVESGLRHLETYIAEEIIPALDKDERFALDVASFFDVAVSSEDLVRAGGFGRETVLSLQRKSLLEKSETRIEVVHDLIKEYLRLSLPQKRKEDIASKVVPWMQEEADRRASQRDFEAAIALLENAVAVDPDRGRRIRSLEHMAYVCRLTGDFPGATEIYREVLDLVQGRTRRARVHRMLGELLLATLHLQEAEDEVERGLQLLSGRKSRETALLRLGQAWLALYREDLEGLREKVEEISSLLPDIPDDSYVIGKLAQVCAVIYTFDPRQLDTERAQAELRIAAEALGGGRKSVDFRNVAEDEWAIFVDAKVGRLIYPWILANMGSLALELDRPGEALEYVDQSIALSEKSGHFIGRLRGIGLKAHLLALKGDLGRAESLYEESFLLASQVDPRYRLIEHYLHFAHLHYWQGRTQEAQESLEYWLRVTADLVGDYVTQEARIEGLAFMVQLCTSLGEVDAARAYLAEAAELAGDRPSPRAKSHLAFADALLFSAQGERNKAIAGFERAAEYRPEFHPSQLEISPSWIHLEYGRFLATTGRTDLAKEVLERARESMAFFHQPMRQAIEGLLDSLPS